MALATLFSARGHGQNTHHLLISWRGYMRLMFQVLQNAGQLQRAPVLQLSHGRQRYPELDLQVSKELTSSLEHSGPGLPLSRFRPSTAAASAQTSGHSIAGGFGKQEKLEPEWPRGICKLRMYLGSNIVSRSSALKPEPPNENLKSLGFRKELPPAARALSIRNPGPFLALAYPERVARLGPHG